MKNKASLRQRHVEAIKDVVSDTVVTDGLPGDTIVHIDIIPVKDVVFTFDL